MSFGKFENVKPVTTVCNTKYLIKNVLFETKLYDEHINGKVMTSDHNADRRRKMKNIEAKQTHSSGVEKYTDKGKNNTNIKSVTSAWWDWSK